MVDRKKLDTSYVKQGLDSIMLLNWIEKISAR